VGSSYTIISTRQACELYTRWCNGEVYGYEVERIVACPACGVETPEPVDSCWGFYGLDECRGEAVSIVTSSAKAAA
jgi:hypothetical protein